MMSLSTGIAQLTCRYLTVSLFVVIITSLISAAPQGPPSSSEDMLGPTRGIYRNQEPIQNTDDNEIPIISDIGVAEQQQIPARYDPRVLQWQPSENAILNLLLLRRRLMGVNRPRAYVDFDRYSNEISKKRSYSKYCAFNAVSCFGK